MQPKVAFVSEGEELGGLQLLTTTFYWLMDKIVTEVKG